MSSKLVFGAPRRCTIIIDHTRPRRRWTEALGLVVAVVFLAAMFVFVLIEGGW